VPACPRRVTPRPSTPHPHARASLARHSTNAEEKICTPASASPSAKRSLARVVACVVIIDAMVPSRRYARDRCRIVVIMNTDVR